MDSRLRGNDGNDECRGSLAYSTAVEAHFRTNDEGAPRMMDERLLELSTGLPMPTNRLS